MDKYPSSAALSLFASLVGQVPGHCISRAHLSSDEPLSLLMDSSKTDRVCPSSLRVMLTSASIRLQMTSKGRMLRWALVGDHFVPCHPPTSSIGVACIQTLGEQHVLKALLSSDQKHKGCSHGKKEPITTRWTAAPG